jgi:hypothetical protein
MGLEGLAHVALEELFKDTDGSATARAAAAKIVLGSLSANSPAGLEVAKRALWAEQQQQMKQEAPTARAKPSA